MIRTQPGSAELPLRLGVHVPVLPHRALTLDVHADNARARRAYERCGFRPSGLRFTGSIGPELEMVRELSDSEGATP